MLGQLAVGANIAGGLFDIVGGISNQRKQAKYTERMWEETAQASFKDASRLNMALYPIPWGPGPTYRNAFFPAL